MPLVISANDPVPYWFKLIRICDRAHERVLRGEGDRMRQRRTLARWNRFDQLRRLECPRLGG
jgi:hypothetical protein